MLFHSLISNITNGDKCGFEPTQENLNGIIRIVPEFSLVQDDWNT